MPMPSPRETRVNEPIVLRRAVLPQLEVGRREVGDGPALAVADDDVHEDGRRDDSKVAWARAGDRAGCWAPASATAAALQAAIEARR